MSSPLRPVSFTRLLTSCLVFSLLQGPAITPAGAAPSWHSKRAPAVQPLTEQERATQALNRLTFGARPGDLHRIQAIGVKKWIDLQLNPEKIDDTLLQARLQAFPAMRLSQPDLLQSFPSAAVIRAVADGKFPLPADRVERAIYQNQVFAYEEKRQKQAAGCSQAAVSGADRGQPQPAKRKSKGKRQPHGRCHGARGRSQFPLHHRA